MEDLARSFLDQSRTFLQAELLPRVRGSVEALPEADLWWRPNEASNSVGNLLLHLEGNVRQWIVAGIGGAPDDRDRQREFDARDPISAAALLDGLERAVSDAATVLRGLPGERLLEEITVQGRRVTVLEAVYHVVEHFSMHTGQIAYVAKLRLGHDLGFYRVENGEAHPRWAGRPRD